MSEKLIFSDLHSHNYREFSESIDGKNSRLLDCCNVILELRKFVDKNKINQIIFLGDMFHLKNNISSEVIKLTMDALDYLIEDREMIVLPGNHDYILWSSKPILLELFQQYITSGVVNVVQKPQWLGNIYYEPYVRNVSELNSRILGLRTAQESVFLGHQDIIGAHYGSYIVERGIDPKLLSEKFKWSFVGHNHKPTEIISVSPENNVISVGAPLQHSFSDIGQNRGWWIYDNKDDSITFHKYNGAPEFHDLYYEDNKATVLRGDPERDFYRITVSGHDLPEEVKAIRWKRVNFEAKKSAKSRSTISFSSSDQDIIKKYVDLKADGFWDKERLISVGRNYIAK